MKHIQIAANDERIYPAASPVLFDRSPLQGLEEKPRRASYEEAVDYGIWLAERAGLCTEFETYLIEAPRDGRGKRSESAPARGVGFGTRSSTGYPEGAYCIAFPGRNASRDKVTMETLDESGAVIASSTMPLEPKKGGVIWDRDAVRKACGVVGRKCPPIPVPATVEHAQPEPLVEAIDAAPAMSGPSDPDSCRGEAHSEPMPMIEPAADPMPRAEAAADDLAARVAALEALVQALSAELKTEHAPASPAAPVSAESALSDRHRSARLRIVRRYLAMRREREQLRANLRIGQAQYDALRARLVDPASPDRLSDVASLRRERDEARAQAATVQGRLANATSMLEKVSDALQQMTSRAFKAEAAMRLAQATRFAVAMPGAPATGAVTFGELVAA